MIPSTIWTAVLLLSPLVQGAVLPKRDGGNPMIQAKLNHAYKPSPHALARALRKWQVRLGTDAHDPGMKGVIANATATPTIYDVEWVTSVGFGTPAQWLPMDLDTGSADVWVYSDLMAPKKLANRTYYSPEQSTTGTEVANSSWTIQYGDGSYASGKIYTDTISLGGVDIKGAAVEAATTVSSSMLHDTKISGVFGLPYKLTSQTYPQFPTVMQDLNPLLDQKVFTVDLRYQANSEYQFGYIDPTKYIGEIQYIPLVAEAGTWWTVEYSLYTFDTMNHWQAVNRQGIVDTGTSLLLLDEDIVSRYYNTVDGAVRNSHAGWVYPCHVDLPSLTLGFSDEAKYEIPGKYMKFAEEPEVGEGMCMGSLQETSEDFEYSILGDIFLKAVFAVFDYDKGAVGFAMKSTDL
ncbi:acid protease [Rhypophila decipiens]